MRRCANDAIIQDSAAKIWTGRGFDTVFKYFQRRFFNIEKLRRKRTKFFRTGWSPVAREIIPFKIRCGTFADSKRAMPLTVSHKVMTPIRQPKQKKSRILLVDDHAVVRFGIAALINRQADMEVCGEEEDGSCAMNAITTLMPDLVIADISLKDSSGLELMRNIKAQYPKMPVLVVSVHDETIYAEVAFRAGALGYLNKEEAIDKILTAIRRVLSGEVYVSDVLGAKLLQKQVLGGGGDISNGSPVKSLSDRELEVFQLIGQWKGTRQIAEELHLSIKTIEYYREQIKKKLNLKNAAELTQYATSWAQREIPT